MTTIRNQVFLLFVTALVFFVFLRIFLLTNDFLQTPIDPETALLCEKDLEKHFLPAVAKYRQCLSDRLSEPRTKIWTQLHLAVDQCLDKSIWRKFNLRYIFNGDDVKWVILPFPYRRTDESCVAVTLGIGNDITAEQKLRRLIPHCKFYGVDPIVEDGQIYRSMGRYFQLAISAQSGRINASVLENGDYHRRNIEAVALDIFLHRYVNEAVIDYLWIDNEGPEFEIFRKYFIDSRDYNFTICQISVEMHAPLENYGMNDSKFNELMLNLLSNSNLLPLWSKEPNQHMQTFYMNLRDRVCLRRYLMYRFCNL